MLRIQAPTFVAGAELLQDRVVRCSPLIRYMKNWSMSKVKTFCECQGWVCDFIPIERLL